MFFYVTFFFIVYHDVWHYFDHVFQWIGGEYNLFRSLNFKFTIKRRAYKYAAKRHKK